MRQALRIAPQSLPDHDLRLLFGAIDSDGSGLVEMTELLRYVSHGSRKSDGAELFRKRSARVRRNLNLAFKRRNGALKRCRRLFRQLFRS